jgi:predicted Zn-dependent peptidase
MKYISLTPSVHLLLESLDRKKTAIKIILTSAGSWFESPQDRGRRHLLEHCILSRTKEMNFQEFKDYTFRENIYTNAYTSKNEMGFVARGHCSDTEKMLDLLLEIVFEPTFDQSDLEREREIVLREISERRGDPNYKLYFDTMKEVYTPDSAENHQVLGESKFVATTSREDFERILKENLEKSHLIISICGGGIDEKSIVNLIHSYLKSSNGQTYFVSNTSKQKLPLNFQLPSSQKTFSTLPIVHPLAHEHADLTIQIGCEIHQKNDPKIKLFDALFLGLHSILWDRLRDELQLVYGISSYYSPKHQKLNVNLSCEIQYIEQIVEEVKKTFSDFDTYFRPKKFEEYKKIVHKKQEIAEDTLGTSTNLALNLLQKYGTFEDFDSYNSRLLDTSIDEIRAIYENIQENLPKLQTIIVSKDEKIKDIALSK